MNKAEKIKEQLSRNVGNIEDWEDIEDEEEKEKENKSVRIRKALTAGFFMNAAKKEVLEKVPWIGPAAASLFGIFWYAQDYKRQEDMHHRF